MIVSREKEGARPHGSAGVPVDARGPAVRKASAILLVVVALVLVFVLGVRKDMTDFGVCYRAGSRALGGESLYRPSDGHLQFKYSPAAALFYIPISVLPWEAAKGVWYALEILFLYGILAASLRLLPAPETRPVLQVLWSFLVLAKCLGREFQLGQVKDILFPEMEKKDRESTKRLDAGDVQSISGNKAKQVLKVKSGIESELAKTIVKLIKDSKLKVQATIQGDAVRVTGAKRDLLQETIALVKKSITDYPLQYGNFRD